MSLFDRNYMRPNAAFSPRRDADGMLGTLIGINVAVFLIALAVPDFVDQYLVLSSAGLEQLRVYQLVTAAFTHTNFWHILFNLWGLWLFGKLVTPYLTGRQFLWLYLIGGIAGNLLFLAFNWQRPFGLLGASGAVFAVTMAAALLQPDRQFMLIFLPFWPLKTKTMVVAYAVLEMLSQLGGRDGVAHLAHLGGFVGGYLYMKLVFGRQLNWDPFRNLTFRPSAAPGPEGPFNRPDWTRDPHYGAQDARDDGKPVSQRELDALLDKVSREGINSLSEYELSRLRRAREQMRGSGR